jgi:hypothetical protein
MRVIDRCVTTLLTLAVLLWTAPVTAQPTPPVLAFTDIVAGPKTGNRDTSQGQRAGVDGAIVTVWGFNLVGAAFTINGAASAAVYYVGNAVPPACGAANLFNGYHKLQCAILQVSHLATSGAGTIVATAGGFTSNALAFTVQAGKIYFAAPSGGDFTSIQAGLNALASGDILYVKNGVSATSGVTVPASSVSPTRPIAVVAYPGAAVQVGDATHDAFKLVYSGSGNSITYAKFSVFNGAVGGTAIEPRYNSRVVGVKVQGPNGYGATGCVILDRGSNAYILGNEFTLCGGDPAVSGNLADGDSLYHVLYIAGQRDMGAANAVGESNREVGWNYFHDNNALRAINIYNDNQGGGANWISGHKVHDNVVVNQTGAGIALLVGVVGENWVYNNLVINAGLKWANGSQSLGVGIHLSAGDPGGESSGLSPLLHVFNNTMLNIGQAGNSGNGAFRLTYGGTIDLHNNLIYQASGLPYISSGSGTPGAGQATQNLWYGAGSAPSFDTAAINADPKLISATSLYDLHLQVSSPALTSGLNMTSGGTGLYDFDGFARPASLSWDIGAYQLGGGGGGLVAPR